MRRLPSLCVGCAGRLRVCDGTWCAECHMRCILHVSLKDDSSLFLLNRVLCGIATHIQQQATRLQEVRDPVRYLLTAAVPKATLSQRCTRSSATTRTSQRGSGATSGDASPVVAMGRCCARVLSTRGYTSVALLDVRRRLIALRPWSMATQSHGVCAVWHDTGLEGAAGNVRGSRARGRQSAIDREDESRGGGTTTHDGRRVSHGACARYVPGERQRSSVHDAVRAQALVCRRVATSRPHTRSPAH